MFPKNITKAHVLSAIKEINTNGIPDSRQSTKYDLEYNNYKYPAKYVISIANKFSNNKFLDPSDFQAKQAIHCLQKLGFDIIDKDNVFYNRINEIDVDLLKGYFAKLDEIIQKIGTTENDEKTVFSVRNGQLSFQVNNRYILTIKKTGDIGFISADIPELEQYKKDIFSSGHIYCKTKDINIIEKNVNEIFSASSKEYDESESIFTKNDNALFRKAVFNKKYREKVIEKYSANYWIFQGNPKVFDVVKYINDAASHNWSVHNHKDKIKIGDKIILWLTGKNAGCYALAEVTSKLYLEANKARERVYYTDHAHKKYDFDNTYGIKESPKMDIKITHNTSDDPISKEQIKRNKDLSKFKGGNQGTNFSSNESEYNAILNMIDNKGSKRKLNYKIWFVCQGSSFTNDQGKKYLFAPEKDKKGNPKYYWSNVSKIKKGDIIVNYSHGIQGISIAKKDAYSGKNPHPKELWQNDGWKVDLDFYSLKPNIHYKEFNNYSKKLIKSLENIKGPIQKDGGVKQGYLFEFNLEAIKIIREKYGMPFPSKIEELLFSKNKKILQFNETKNMKNPKNKILFGPPGTGKTYKLSHEYFSKYTTTESSLTRMELLENLIRENKYTWFDVIAAVIKMEGTCKVNEIAKHELILAKTNVSDTNSVKPCIWGQLQGHTDIKCENVNYTNRVEPQIMWKNDDSSWQFANNDIDDLIEESLVLINEFNRIEDIRVDAKLIRRYEFVTFHQAFSYEDFIEGIKPVMDDETDDIKYEIKSGVFKQICKRAENDPANKYALFIDEINRGNVANIFGELITLIEPDKREGMDNALSVILPYSKTIFSVPNNLDIIGTMNTADRSVEALDTALRRRFEFEEMLPNSSLLSNITCEGINFKHLLNAINGRIEKLLDKDHQIGHSYFMNSSSELSIIDLQGIFKNKIMPLLQEYFYGDFGKIGLVLGNRFITENKEKSDFAKFDYDDRDLIDERKVYQLADIDKLEASDFISIYEKNE